MLRYALDVANLASASRFTRSYRAMSAGVGMRSCARAPPFPIASAESFFGRPKSKMPHATHTCNNRERTLNVTLYLGPQNASCPAARSPPQEQIRCHGR